MMKRIAKQTARILCRTRAGNVALFALAALILPGIASACDSTGLFTIGGGTRKCDTAQLGVFGSVLCFFETALEAMLGGMYCVFMTRLQAPVTAAMSIAISVFGLCVLTGYIRMQFREAAKMILKLALVTAFAFNSDYAIRMVGTLFMGLLQQGTSFIITPMGGSTMLTQPDNMIKGLFNFMSNPNLSLINQTNDCGGQPCLNDAVLRIITGCAAFLAVIVIGLMVFLPVVFAFLFMLFVQYIALFVKAILGYLTSIVIITFLLVLSPMFISFALFSPTYRLFERWVQYLRMFSIQGIILFAFLAMLGVATQGFTGFLYGILRLLRPYDIAMNVMLWTIPISNACSICEYKIEQLATGSQTIKCQPAIRNAATAPPAVIPSAFPPRSGGIGVTGGTNSSATMPTGVSPASPITYDLTMGAVLSNQQNVMPGDAAQNNGYNYVIPIMALLSKADLILYVAMNIIAFGIIASLFQEFIGRSGEMARKLGGVSGAGGFGGHADFESGGIELGGMQAVERGIKGMEKEMLRNPFSNVKGDSFFHRFRDGLFGRGTVSRSDFRTQEGYLEAKKGEMLTGGFLGAMMHGIADDQKEKEREYDLKLAQRRVDDAALKVKEARESAEGTARELSDALDAQDAARKKGDASAVARATAAVEKAKLKYDSSYKAALERQNTLRKRKQDLRDAEYDMRAAMQGGMMPAGGRVIEAGAGGAALLAGSHTLKRAHKKLSEEEKYQDELKKNPKAIKKVSDLNAGAASQASRTNRPQNADRGNSSDELLTAQQEANQKIADLESQMTQYGRFLTEDQRAEYQRALAAAKSSLGNARSERDTYEAMKGLISMEASLDKFSDRHVAENVAMVGAAALGVSLVAASGIVPAAYLQETKKFLEGAEKEMKSGSAGTAKVNEELSKQPQKLAASTVNGVQGSATMAAHIVPQSALAQSTAQVKKAESTLEAAKGPEDYLKVITQLDGVQKTQLSEVLSDLGFRREMAQATLASAVALPAGWDRATYEDKRKYMTSTLDKTREQLASTEGLRSAKENEEHKQEMERIRLEMEAASTEEEFKELLRRTTALGQKANNSVLPTSPMNMFAGFDQMMQTAQAAAGSARTGNDYSEAMRSLLGAPQALNQTVIGGLQQHMNRHRDLSLWPEETRRKMELHLAQANMQTQRAATGQQQEDILTKLGRQFVGGGEQAATISMARFDSLPEDRKRTEAENELAKSRKEYEKMASRLSEQERKEYEEQFTKASAAISSASSPDQLRGAMAHSLSIGVTLDRSAAQLRQRQSEEDTRNARARVDSLMDKPFAGTTTGQITRDMPVIRHVNNTLSNWDSVQDKKRREYEEAVMESLGDHYKGAVGAMSEADDSAFGGALVRTRQEYDEAKAQLAAAKTEEERKAAESNMREVMTRAAALEARLHDFAEQEENARREREKKKDDESVILDDDEDKRPHTDIRNYMPAVNTATLTGTPGVGYGLYSMQALTGFDRMSDSRKREYVGAFIEKSKAEIDTFKKLSDDEKKKYKAELDRVSTGLATESSDKEMRDALTEALKTVGRIDAREPAGTTVTPQFVSTSGANRSSPSALAGAALGGTGVAAQTTIARAVPGAPAGAGPQKKEEERQYQPMSEAVGKIEVAGKTYETNRVYDRLEDFDKERVQKILSRNPELTLQQAIERMNDEQAVRRRNAKQEESKWTDEDDDESGSSGKKSTAGGVSKTSVANQQRDRDRKADEAKKRKTLDNMTPGQRESIRKMMAKNPGMTMEQAIININLKGKTQ